jgi:hypothetical protein
MERDAGVARWLRYAPPVAALSVAWLLQVTVVTDVLGTALTDRYPLVQTWVWYTAAALLGIAVATSLETGAAYLMGLYDRHLLARDAVWQLRAGMLVYVGVSALVIHWWLRLRDLPEITALVLGGMSASALWLWSRGARWAQRREMVAAGQIDPALPRLPTVSKVLHPIRWIVTLYLISWEPVATTAEARERYAEWKRNRRPVWRSRRHSADGGGSSRSASGSATRTSARQARGSNRSAGAAGATGSRRGGSTGTPRRSPPSSNGNGTRPQPGTSKQQRITVLASEIFKNGWHERSANQIVSLLRDSTVGGASKPIVLQAREEARRMASESYQPDQTGEVRVA